MGDRRRETRDSRRKRGNRYWETEDKRVRRETGDGKRGDERQQETGDSRREPEDGIRET